MVLVSLLVEILARAWMLGRCRVPVWVARMCARSFVRRILPVAATTVLAPWTWLFLLLYVPSQVLYICTRTILRARAEITQRQQRQHGPVSLGLIPLRLRGFFVAVIFVITLINLCTVSSTSKEGLAVASSFACDARGV